ncbi:MAG: formylmethanofuran--tetrahydromethanopterin N-formyltransferase [Planctomycetaceae bacterium]
MDQSTKQKHDQDLDLCGVPIEDTFAEAFPIVGARVILTASSLRWAQTAAREMCGHATSVIACDVEAGIECEVPASCSPDGRPGVRVLVFAFNRDALAKSLVERVGQCVLTCPTTACYDGLPDIDDDRVRVGGQLRFFGDGFQASKKLGNRRFWRIPVMDGEFCCEDRVGTVQGVAGGNLILSAVDQRSALAAAEAGVAAIAEVSDVILPFPGGIVRSGSKVGSRYKALKASTNDAYCPTLRARTDTRLPTEAQAAYEIVIDGLSFDAVGRAMKAGLHAAVEVNGLTGVTAGNYGGKLGPHHFYLRDLLSADSNDSDQECAPS